ncbi:MAG: hypothetical protein WAK17_11520 [Candidatus Nitrosopolaris sp.]
MLLDAILQLNNIENGYILAFAIGIPLAVWGYLSYLKQESVVKKLPHR